MLVEEIFLGKEIIDVGDFGIQKGDVNVLHDGVIFSLPILLLSSLYHIA